MSDAQEKAKSMGWVDPETWQGDPPPQGFLSAEEFVERGEQILPILKGHNRELQEKVDSMQSQIDEQKDVAAQFQSFAEKAIARERREATERIQTLETRLKDAVDEGDGDAAVQTQRELEEARTVASQPDKAEKKILDKWLAENDWFNKDPGLRLWCDGRALRANGEGVPRGLPTLQLLEREVKAEFPERFPDGQYRGKSPPPPSPERGGHRPTNVKAGRTFDDLPQDAQDACVRFEQSIPGHTRAKYLEMYEWDE